MVSCCNVYNSLSTKTVLHLIGCKAVIYDLFIMSCVRRYPVYPYKRCAARTGKGGTSTPQCPAHPPASQRSSLVRIRSTIRGRPRPTCRCIRPQCRSGHNLGLEVRPNEHNEKYRVQCSEGLRSVYEPSKISKQHLRTVKKI